MLADGAASYRVHSDVSTEHLARDLVPSGAIIRGTRDTRTVLAVSWGCLCIYICYLLSVRCILLCLCCCFFVNLESLLES